MTQMTLDPSPNLQSLQSSTPPVNAFRFEAPLEFAKPKSGSASSGDTKSRAVQMLARTNKVLSHWYWGRCVHDFAGMRHGERIVLDYCHRDRDIIGFADEFIVDENGLTLRGRVESIEENDEAEKMLKRMDKGVPYQSSIYFDEAVIEWVPENLSAEVNGETIPGPLCVFRKWLLRASSACPHGYDSDSNTVSSEKSFATKFTWTNPMSSNQTNTQTTPDPREELKAFTDKFGSDGVTYFTNKLSISDAALAHIDTLSKRHADEVAKLTASHVEATTKLTTELDSVRKERDEAAGKLKAAQLSHGEAESIDTGSPGKTESGSPSGFGQFIRKATK
jgi:hypothetical protein